MYVEVPVTESDSDVSAGRWRVRMPVRRAGKQPPRNRREEAGDQRGSSGAVPSLGAAEVTRLCVPAASVVQVMEACPPARLHPSVFVERLHWASPALGSRDAAGTRAAAPGGETTRHGRSGGWVPSCCPCPEMITGAISQEDDRIFFSIFYYCKIYIT